MAKVDGRSNIRNNIFIHGDSVSDGCIAIGDDAIEELFQFTVDIGKKDIQVIISPTRLNFLKIRAILL